MLPTDCFSELQQSADRGQKSYKMKRETTRPKKLNIEAPLGIFPTGTLEHLILQRMRSPVTSRSNCANESSTLRVSRPIEVVVLNCWVTETNETPWPSKTSTIFAKSASERVSRSLKRKSGARGLRAIIESITVDLRYEIPEVATQKEQSLLVYTEDR